MIAGGGNWLLVTSGYSPSGYFVYVNQEVERSMRCLSPIAAATYRLPQLMFASCAFSCGFTSFT